MTTEPVSDEELILYHFRAGLPHERLAHIEHELAYSSLLKRRYDRVCAELAAVDREPPPPLPAEFEERLWGRLQARIHVSPHAKEIEPRSRNSLWSHWKMGLAAAAAAVLTKLIRCLKTCRVWLINLRKSRRRNIRS